MLAGTSSLADMPAGLVQNEHGMGVGGDIGGDFLQMCGHGVGIAPGHDQPGGLALLRANRAEDVGPFGALVVRRARTRAAPRPAAGDLVLLADARLVLPPHFYRDAGWQARFDPCQLGRETFLKACTAASFCA